MKFEQLSPELEAEFLNATSPAELDPVMAKVLRLYNPVLAPGAPGHKLFAPDLDRAIPHAAKVLGFADQPGVRSNDNVCILATQFLAVGGHTRVAADISRLIGGARVSIILTDCYRNTPYRELLTGSMAGMGFDYRAFMFLKAPNMADRTIELYNILLAIRPTRIFLLNNHMDTCSVIGTYPFRSITDFLHHGDHEPCLGATVPYAAHVDLTHGVYLNCRAAGLSTVYSSMTLPEVKIAETPPAGVRRIATCGHVAKYQKPGRYHWAEWATALLSASDAEFLHLGPVSEAFVTEVRTTLGLAGVDPARYVFKGPVKSVQAELLRHGVSAYVSSAPEAGGRANLEALAARVPVIVPVDPETPPLLRFSLPLRGWTDIFHPAEAAAALAACEAVRADMASPAYAADLAAELGRFEAYVAGAELPDIAEPAA